jgi:hypothetical protein
MLREKTERKILLFCQHHRSAQQQLVTASCESAETLTWWTVSMLILRTVICAIQHMLRKTIDCP